MKIVESYRVKASRQEFVVDKALCESRAGYAEVLALLALKRFGRRDRVGRVLCFEFGKVGVGAEIRGGGREWCHVDNGMLLFHFSFCFNE